MYILLSQFLKNNYKNPSFFYSFFCCIKATLKLTSLRNWFIQFALGLKWIFQKFTASKKDRSLNFKFGLCCPLHWPQSSLSRGQDIFLHTFGRQLSKYLKQSKVRWWNYLFLILKFLTVNIFFFGINPAHQVWDGAPDIDI